MDFHAVASSFYVIRQLVVGHPRFRHPDLVSWTKLVSFGGKYVLYLHILRFLGTSLIRIVLYQLVP